MNELVIIEKLSSIDYACSILFDMKKRSDKIPVLAIVGPTAVGKSALALSLAEERGYEIISCDSRQIYKGMDIGTAKPLRAEQVRVKHHLIDICTPHERYSSSDFVRDAGAVIRTLHAQGKRAVICGGTGLYYQALSLGLAPAPGTDAAIRRELELRVDKGDFAGLYAELMRIDPVTAARSHAANVQRNIRQLEIFYTTGIIPSQLKKNRQPPADIDFFPVVIELGRAELYQRINARVDAMMAAGLQEEFLALRRSGIKIDAPGLTCVGYKELCAVENGLALTAAVALIKQNSRHYAKRQLTWFNHQLPAGTLRCGPDYAEFIKLVPAGFD